MTETTRAALLSSIGGVDTGRWEERGHERGIERERGWVPERKLGVERVRFHTAESRRIRADIAVLTEEVAALLDPGHPTVSALMEAADELAAAALAGAPRSYATDNQRGGED